MKYFTLLLLFISLYATSQIESSDTLIFDTPESDSTVLNLDKTTIYSDDSFSTPAVVLTDDDDKGFGFGSLKCSVIFNQTGGCSTNNLILTSNLDTLKFLRFQSKDTLSNIPEGNYIAHFYNCDSSYQYSQMIEIVADELIYFNYYNNVNNRFNQYDYNNYYEYDESYYSDDDDYTTTAWLNHGIQFGRGLDYDNKSVKVESNYSFQYSVGQDYSIFESPIALGFDFGLRYSQSNFEKTDFIETSVIHDKYCFSSFGISSTFLASIYAGGRKFIDIGVMYNMPIYSRIVSEDGDQKTSTKNVHTFHDFRFVAHVGYWWGFLYAEYRPDIIVKVPYEDAPKLNLGIRLNIPLEWW